MTLSQYKWHVSQFIKHLEEKHHFSIHTLRAYQTDLDQFADFWLSKENQYKKTLFFEASLFQEFMMQFEHHHTARSVARKLSSFNSFKKYLYDNGTQVELNYIRPHITSHIPESLSVEDITYLLDNLNPLQLPTQSPLRDKAVMELLYATGMRPSELIQLQIAHVNITDKTVKVVSNPKKNRIVPFGQKAQEALLLYLQHERSKIKNSLEPFFFNHRGQSLTTRSIQRICNMFGNLLPKKKMVTPHILRNSCAQHMINRGASLETVKSLLGLTESSLYKYLNQSQC
jgi:site-specific recombinase XerD